MSSVYRNGFTVALIMPLLLTLLVHFVYAAPPPPNTVIANLMVGSRPDAIAFDSSNSNLYVANSEDNHVSVIDGSTNTVVDTIMVGLNPEGIAYDHANHDLYVSNTGSDTVSVIDGSTDTVSATIPVGSVPTGVAFDSANHKVYVTNCGDLCSNSQGTVSVIDTKLNNVVDIIKVGLSPSSPLGIAYDRANNDLYVANADSSSVSVIDGGTDTIVGTIPVTTDASSIAYDPVNQDVYVSGRVISVIDSSTNNIVTTIPIFAVGIALDLFNNELYAATPLHTVSVIDPSTNAVMTTITVGTDPTGVAYDPRNRDVYVTENGLPTTDIVTVIATQ